MKHKETKKDTLQTYWHCSTTKYNVDDIINTGNFCSSVCPVNAVTVLELMLEIARNQTAPQEVSRLNCIFACETKEELAQFIAKYRYIELEKQRLFAYTIQPTEICNTTKRPLDLPILENSCNINLMHSISTMSIYWLMPANTLLPKEILIPINCKVTSLEHNFINSLRNKMLFPSVN